MDLMAAGLVAEMGVRVRAAAAAAPGEQAWCQRLSCCTRLRHTPRPMPMPQGGDVTQRRALVCAYLGLGDCDGKQLLRQLNCYGFGREELAAALAWAEQQLRVQ